MFVQQAINGLSVGAVYGLAAVGYALVYSVLRFSNFAHGDITMVGAYFALVFFSWLGVHPILILIAGSLMAGMIALLLERTVYRPLYMRGAPTLYLFVAAMAAGIVLQNTVLVVFGATFRTLPAPVEFRSLHFASITLEVMDIFVFSICVISVVLLEIMINKTKIGRSIRAASYDRETAALMGISITTVAIIIFMTAGFLGGLSGILRGMQYSIYPAMGYIIIKAWICAILGGLGSITGAFIGGILLGFSEAMVVAYISSAYRDVFTFLILITVVLVRPSGIMGKMFEEKS